MLTTTVDGLWVLQALSGCEVLAPELGLRPYLPSAESRDSAMSHPLADELRAVRVIDERGTVDDTVLEWLTALSRREVALLIHIERPDSEEPERIVVARFSRWWVTLQRFGALIRLSGLGTATGEGAANVLIASQIARLCGRLRPADFRPATLDVAQLLTSVSDAGSLRAVLIRHGLDPDQIRTLTLAADPRRSAHASIVGLQSGIPTSPAGSFVSRTGVSIIDTTEGRLVSEQVERDGRRWMIISPGSSTSIASAVRTMMRHLPSGDSWHTRGKAAS